jgi:hypothetical protein
MKASPRQSTDFPKTSLSITPADLAEQSLIPIHWPEALKLLVLLTALWALTLGVFFVICVVGWIIGL